MNRNFVGLVDVSRAFTPEFSLEFAQALGCKKPKSSENKMSIFAMIATRKNRILENFILEIIIFCA